MTSTGGSEAAKGDEPPMLEMSGLRKVYRAGLVETEALAGASVTVRRGEFLAIMGPSGSGKTTFLSVAGLLDDFQGGEYLLDGEDVRRLSDRRLSRLRNQKIGFIFQSFNLDPRNLDVFDNVDVPLRYRGLPAAERDRRIEEILAKLGLVARMRHLPGQLSGGQQQRVAIARARSRASRSCCWPTSRHGQPRLCSPRGRSWTCWRASTPSEGMTIVMVTHDHEFAARAHRKLHILDGKLIDPEAR